MAKKKTKKNTKKNNKITVKKAHVENATIKNVEIGPEQEITHMPTKVEKKESKRLLNNTLVAVLYLVCSVLWFVSMVINIIAKENYLIDLVVGILLLLASFLYFYKAKKEK